MSTTSVFSGLEPSRLWHHFAAITTIGRTSGEEAAMSAYIESWANEHKFKMLRDAFGNVCVQIPGTPGREAAPVIILQGHLDMVCVNSPAAAPEFNAEQGKIRVVKKSYPDSDYLEADVTTLGADNGIAIAAMCAIAEDTKSPRGPLDLLMTLEEETGMFGAANLDPAILAGRTMLNLDSEDDDALSVGCAGGGDCRLHFTRSREAVPSSSARLKVTINELKGGHSGLEIDKNRLNGIKALVRLLQTADTGLTMCLATIAGGDRRNAIPRWASAELAVPSADLAGLRQRLQAAYESVADQYQGLEPDISLSLDELGSTSTSSVFNASDTQVLLNMLRTIPVGVDALSQSIPGLVETSSNMGIVKTHGDTVEIFCNTRSSVAPAFRDLVDRMGAIAKLAGVEFEELPSYPGWKVNLESKVLGVVKRSYERLFHAPPHVTAVHAGLEAGVIMDKVPGMDVVSFGPNIRGAHAPGERVSIKSVGKFYELLKAVLDNLSATPAK